MITTEIEIMNNLLDDFYRRSIRNNNDNSCDDRSDYLYFHFKIKSSPDQITKTVQKFDQLLERNNCCSSRTKSELATALSEALANAIIHGNKTRSEKLVDLKIHLDKNKMILKIKDQGSGFDYTKLPNPLNSENIMKPSGRGIYLMSVLVDQVKFVKHKSGMEVILVKNLPERN